MISLLEAVILGVTQGVLEWFPVSSQGNLVLIMILLFGLEPSGTLGYSVYLHIGTGFAALIYFRDKIRDILLRKTEIDKKLFNYLLVSTLLTGLLGFPLYRFAETTLFMGESILAVTGTALIVTGFIQRHEKDVSIKDPSTLSNKHGLLMGVIQAFTALPGVSRSGLTTSVLLILGFSAESSLEVSFLMSIPTVLAAGIGLSITKRLSYVSAELIIGILTSFLTAYITIDTFLRLAKRLNFWKICVLLGVIALTNIIPYLL
ncbi:MAG: undecaprenyl-diphosphate phosphatase [Candidatus Bathyarchaeia archaeon]